jgi:hypothetical protein
MRARRILIVFCALLSLLAVLPTQALALDSNNYQPPAIAVVAHGFPRDLEIQVEVQKGGERVLADTVRTQRVWELSFRLYRKDVFRSGAFRGNDRDFAGAALLCRSGGEEHRVPIPQECLTPGGSRDVMTLDCESWTLRPGLPAWRGAASFAERLLVILAAKALLFLLMNYRRLRSWLGFLGANLLTQVPLNLSLNNMIWVDNDTWHYRVFVGSLLLRLFPILVAEILLLSLSVQEHDRDRTAIYSVTANALGIVTLIAALTLLPV